MSKERHARTASVPRNSVSVVYWMKLPSTRATLLPISAICLRPAQRMLNDRHVAVCRRNSTIRDIEASKLVGGVSIDFDNGILQAPKGAEHLLLVKHSPLGFMRSQLMVRYYSYVGNDSAGKRFRRR